jgi:release factor glutamine methyltransferase
LQKKFVTNDEYKPAEDTFFLADYVEQEKGYSALDVGSGSGFLTQLLCKNFSFVVGTDINFPVLKNQTYKTNNVICCNGADAINYEFDLIICNLPYLATEEIIDVATDGGKEGFQIPKKIFDSVFDKIKPRGKFLFVTSSLSNYQKLIDYTHKSGLKSQIVSRKKLFFEELILVESVKF